jgi:hypothetical protein
LIVNGDAFVTVAEPAEAALVGNAVSRLIVWVFVDVPPLLVAVQVIAVVPSVLTVVVVVSRAHEAERDVTADSGSVTVKLTVMLPVLYQPFEPFGLAGETTGVITGPVESQIRVTEVLAVADELPAASVETALMVFAPQASGTPRRVKEPRLKDAAEPLTVTLATPLVASFAVPLTSMVEAVVDDGRPPSATVGITVSRLIVWVFVDVPPLLVAVQVIAVVPSVLTVVVVESRAHEAERDVTADSGSVTVKLTVMLPLLYQPFEPFGLAGVTTGAMVGGVLSTAGAWYVARYESLFPPLGFRTQMLDAVVVVMGLSLGDPVDQFLKVQPDGVVALVGAVNFTNVFPTSTPEPPVCTESPAPSLFTTIELSIAPAPVVQAAFVKPWSVRVNETPEPAGPEEIFNDASVKEVEAVPETLVAVTL